MTEDTFTPELAVIPVADPIAQLPLAIEPTKRISTAVRVANLIAVIVPFAALVLAIASLWGRGFTWIDFGLLASMYFLTVLGITVGFHRLFTHRAFETNTVVAFVFGVLGSMAVQTKAGIIFCLAPWRSVRDGTIRITPFRHPPATACDGGNPT